jgi:hypothetical protein
MSETTQFCVKCFSAQELVETVRVQGSIITECKICHSNDVIALAADNPVLKQNFRVLIRVHCSEWSYKDHIRGDSISDVLFGKNSIMNLSDITASKDEFEYAIDFIESEWYPKTDNEISLGGGYWDGGILVSVNSSLDSKLIDLLNRSFKKNYFQIQNEVSSLLKSLNSDIELNLPIGSRLYRARIGVKKCLTDGDHGYEPRYLYLPYPDIEIGPLPVHLSTEGRLNRARVSILYLASNRETAVAEVRPHPGHLVSTAEFISKVSLKLADLTHKDIRNFFSDKRLEVLRLIFSFNTLMNLPIPPDKHEYYLLTQLLSDCVRESGFNGVKFQSSLGTGANVACVSADSFSIVPGSERVHEVCSLKYRLKYANRHPRNYHAEDYDDGSNDPFSTLFDIIDRNKQ